MKTPVPFLLFTLALALPAFTQSPRPTRGASGGSGSRGAPHTPDAPTELDKNISISLTGMFSNGTPADITLTGCGRIFQTDAIMGQSEIAGNPIPVLSSIEFAVSPKGTDYIVTYNIGMRMPVPTSSMNSGKSGGLTTNISFQEVMLSGTAKCAIGKEVKIFRSGTQTLSLAVTEP